MSTVEQRYSEEWSRYAGELVTVEQVGGVVYGFGSEVACFRVFYRRGVGRVGYSPTLQTWFYANE